MISFAAGPGDLFPRLGKLALVVGQARTYQDAQYLNLIDGTYGAFARLSGEPDLAAMIGSSYAGVLNAAGTVGGLAQNVAAATVNRVVYRDNPLVSQTLFSGSTLASLQEVIRQMVQQGVTVPAIAVSATGWGMFGRGDGGFFLSLRRPLDGALMQNAFAENLTAVCVADSYTGGVSEGNELFTVSGEGREDNPFAFDWPAGSGGQIVVACVNGESGVNSLLRNGGFEDWTAGVPDGYAVDTGTLYEETTLVYSGESSLRLTGTGGALKFRQPFDSTAGTGSRLAPLTQYGYGAFMRRDGAAAAAGTLAVELVDGSGTVIQDASGSDNSFNIDLTSLTTSYLLSTGVFRTPRVLPTQYSIQWRYTTGGELTSGRSVYMDRVSLGLMSQIYTHGPFTIGFSGATPFFQGTRGTCTVSNPRGVGGTLNTWQTALARLFYGDVFGSELLFPASATPTISDGLIALYA